jgi:hypothetical protein
MGFEPTTAWTTTRQQISIHKSRTYARCLRGQPASPLLSDSTNSVGNGQPAALASL